MKRWMILAVRELARMRTAIALLGAAAVFSAVGTALPQGLPLKDYVAEWGVFWAQVFWYCGLTDVFAAWWYLGLWLVLLASVGTCVWRNGPVIWREMFLPRRVPDLRRAAQMPVEPGMLGARGFMRLGEVDGHEVWVAGRLNRLGYFGVHVGVLLVALGGLATGIFGWRGTLNIREGETDHVALVWKGDKATPKFLPFRLTNEEFVISFYDSGMPERFATRLRIEGDGPVRIEELEVSRPLRVGLWWNGYRFYQASFGDGGSQIAGQGLDARTGRLTRFEGQVYQAAKLADGTRVELLDFRPFTVETLPNVQPTDVGPSLDYLVQPPDAPARQLRAYLNHPQLIGVADGQNSEGAVQYRAVDLGVRLDDARLWPVVAAVRENPDSFKNALAPVLKAIESTEERVAVGLAVMRAVKTLDTLELTHLVQLQDFTLQRYTGLQVAYDPGGWLFWPGGVVLSLGVVLMLGGRFGRVYVRGGRAFGPEDVVQRLR